MKEGKDEIKTFFPFVPFNSFDRIKDFDYCIVEISENIKRPTVIDKAAKAENNKCHSGSADPGAVDSGRSDLPSVFLLDATRGGAYDHLFRAV